MSGNDGIGRLTPLNHFLIWKIAPIFGWGTFRRHCIPLKRSWLITVPWYFPAAAALWKAQRAFRGEPEK